MSQTSHAATVLSSDAEDALAALTRLARKGAYAAPSVLAADGADYAVFSPDNGFGEAIATLPARVVLQARSRGWLERKDGDRLRLAAAGVRALRSALGGKPNAGPAPRRGGKRREASKVGEPKAPSRAGRESSLAWLRRRRDKDGQPLINEAQYSAGERLGADYWRALMMPRVTADWSGVIGARGVARTAPGFGSEMRDSVVAARERVNRALAAVGPELAGILVDVCCHDVGLEAAERAEAWPQRAGKVILQLALTRLARHYGLIAPERPGGTRLRHWGDDTYRPDLEAWR